MVARIGIHHAQIALANLAGAISVPVEIECGIEKGQLVGPNLRKATDEFAMGAIEVIATVAENELWISIVHRGLDSPVQLTVDLNDVDASGQVEIRTLSAGTPWPLNSSSRSMTSLPIDSLTPVTNQHLFLRLEPFSVVRFRIPGR